MVPFAMEIPITFLGIADHVDEGPQPFPLGSLDIYRLSQNKAYIFYPAPTQNTRWVFIVNMDLCVKDSINELNLRIIYEEGDEFGNLSIEFGTMEFKEIIDSEGIQKYKWIALKNQRSSVAVIHQPFSIAVTKPGSLIIQLENDNEYVEIGRANFHYSPTPQLTIDQKRAIESSPNSVKQVRYKLGCKYCPSTIEIYSGVERNKKLESEGSIWQHDLEDTFKCACGKVNQTLEYLRESLHGMLLKKDLLLQNNELSYVRQYSHSRILNIIDKFSNLLSREKLEEPIQKFIEHNPIILAQFHAKILKFKPNILGKFNADFLIVDSQSRLFFIEIEKPSIKLFKKDGHPTAKLNHAYEQVRDWLYEYSKHSLAILDSLNINHNEINFVGGIVIAGRKSPEIIKALNRHLSTPLYSDIDFYTFDDLSNNLAEMSRNMA